MHLKVESGDIEDKILWEKFKEGDENAFSKIFHTYYSILYNYGMKLSNNEDLTKDCIQELYITLWKNRENLGNADSIRFYLLKSIRRKMIRAMQFKKKKFEYKLNDNYEFEIVFSIESVIIREEYQKDQQEYFFQLLNSLSKRQKEAIYLKFYQNLSYEEISQVMDVNYQSVRNYIHQAITTLRSKINIPAKLLMLMLALIH
jgi:RNA polymerase sigma factor (sigma-70 family)